MNGIGPNANAGTLFHKNDARIDLQGLFNQNNMRFANIQIQMNVPRVPGESTTIAVASREALPDRIHSQSTTRKPRMERA